MVKEKQGENLRLTNEQQEIEWNEFVKNLQKKKSELFKKVILVFGAPGGKWFEQKSHQFRTELENRYPDYNTYSAMHILFHSTPAYKSHRNLDFPSPDSVNEFYDKINQLLNSAEQWKNFKEKLSLLKSQVLNKTMDSEIIKLELDKAEEKLIQELSEVSNHESFVAWYILNDLPLEISELENTPNLDFEGDKSVEKFYEKWKKDLDDIQKTRQPNQ